MVLIRQTQVRFYLVNRRRGQYLNRHRVHGSTTVAQILLMAFGNTLQVVCTAALSVHPLGEQPAKEFYMVFGQLFNTADKGLFNGTKGAVGSFSIVKINILNDQPDLMLTNGMAFKYVPINRPNSKDSAQRKCNSLQSEAR